MIRVVAFAACLLLAGCADGYGPVRQDKRRYTTVLEYLLENNYPAAITTFNHYFYGHEVKMCGEVLDIDRNNDFSVNIRAKERASPNDNGIRVVSCTSKQVEIIAGCATGRVMLADGSRLRDKVIFDNMNDDFVIGQNCRMSQSVEHLLAQPQQ